LCRAVAPAAIVAGGLWASGCAEPGGLAPSGTGGHGQGGGPSGTGGAGVGGADVVDSWQAFPAVRSSQVEILFMIDNSQSMAPLQQKLYDGGLPAFVGALENTILADGTTGLPDIHIAVITSDTGPGAFDLPDRHCRYLGDQGMFQTKPTGICTPPPLPADQHFFAATPNQATKNYQGDILGALSCVALVGDQGCGFEGQLKLVRWALDPSYVPTGNEGFLRDDAQLAVILVTNEDDCSVPDDPSQELMSDPLGPLWSFRCNEFGHLSPPARAARWPSLRAAPSTAWSIAYRMRPTAGC
jgi:hypothetical protein